MSEHTPIPGYPGYEIDTHGQVFSVGHNWRGYGRRKLVQDIDSHGYPSVRVTVEGRRKRIPVYRLIAATFLRERPSSKHEVRHLDGNKRNSHYTNLEWGTRKDNAQDRAVHGRTSKGSRHSEAIKVGIRASTNPYWRHARG